MAVKNKRVKAQLPAMAEKPPDWLRQVPIKDFPKGMRGAAGSDICWCSDLATQVWGKKIEKDSGLSAFAYLWRRFGPPFFPSDPYKDLCSYVLTTPHPEVFLSVGAKGCGLAYSVHYWITRGLEDAFREPETEWTKKFYEWLENKEPVNEEIGLAEAWSKENLQEACKVIGERPLSPLPQNWLETDGTMYNVNYALASTMVELLRPVYIRDCAFNILGRCDDPDFAATTSPYAGQPIPFFEPNNESD